MPENQTSDHEMRDPQFNECEPAKGPVQLSDEERKEQGLPTQAELDKAVEHLRSLEPEEDSLPRERYEKDVAWLDSVFTYHSPIDDQPKRYEVLRKKAKEFAEAIMVYVPESEERDQALKRLRESVMWANSGIACNESRDEEVKDTVQ